MTVQLEFVSAVSLVTGKKDAVHDVQYIVSKEFVTKPMVAVHGDVHRDCMETCVIDHAVTNVTQIIMDLPVLWNATMTVKIALVMALLVCVLWDVRGASTDTNVTDNVRVVRQVVID